MRRSKEARPKRYMESSNRMNWSRVGTGVCEVDMTIPGVCLVGEAGERGH